MLTNTQHQDVLTVPAILKQCTPGFHAIAGGADASESASTAPQSGWQALMQGAWQQGGMLTEQEQQRASTVAIRLLEHLHAWAPTYKAPQLGGLRGSNQYSETRA